MIGFMIYIRKISKHILKFYILHFRSNYYDFYTTTLVCQYSTLHSTLVLPTSKS